MKLLLAVRHLWRRWFGHRRCLKRIARLELELALADFVPLYLELQVRLVRGRILSRRATTAELVALPGYRWPVSSATAVSAVPLQRVFTEQGLEEARRLRMLPPGTVLRQRMRDGLYEVSIPG